MAKLTWDQVDAIREKYATGEFTQRGLADEFGVSKRAVFNIVHRNTWRDERQLLVSNQGE